MIVVSITGQDSHSATTELVREFHDAVRTQIQPTCIACETTNQMPAWRFHLQRIMSISSGRMIINDMGPANCDEITDFTRSVRALSNTYHPLVFSTEPYECVQVNGTYSLETVKYILGTHK